MTEVLSLQSQLIDKVRRNDRRAQMQLYEQYCDGMFAVAMRYLPDADEASDAVQDAFIKAFSKLDQFREEVRFGAWLKRIVINTCLDAVKAKRNHVSLDENHLHLVDDEDWEVEEDIGLEEIKDAVNQLSDKYKYVLLLFLFEGYSHKEIAEALHITEVASRSQLLRGRTALKELLKEKRYGTGY